jgi:hypothetical protein
MATQIDTLIPYPCKGCGTEIRKRTFCTNDCRADWYRRTCAERDRAKARARGVRPIEEVRATQIGMVRRQCIVCDATFERRPNGRDAGKCCSRACGFVYRRWIGEHTRSLTQARKEFARWARRAREAPRPLRRARPGKACLACGTEVAKHKQRCEPCREERRATAKAAYRQSDACKAIRRAAKSRRRAIERGIEAERFDPFEIFERDGWKCHLCGCRTPKKLRGTYDDRAPELDHVIPLAAGGEHSRRNTACACRKCNIKKSDRPLGQLRLVA